MNNLHLILASKRVLMICDGVTFGKLCQKLKMHYMVSNQNVNILHILRWRSMNCTACDSCKEQMWHMLYTIVCVAPQEIVRSLCYSVGCPLCAISPRDHTILKPFYYKYA